ncbi:MAG: BMP family ABC transporter substrate-binding protein [Oscillospiraceae bacterium]|jgi:basic membrane protein A|nr:BMP family ABC transporter substrate-binding protein [Oscillospiraceae bacterium]
MKKVSLVFLLFLLPSLVLLTGCPQKQQDGSLQANVDSRSVGMVTDFGGVTDGAFNQLAWEGIQNLKNKGAFNIKEVGFLESKKESEYRLNLEKFVDKSTSLIFGVGFDCEKAIKSVAEENPNIKFALIDKEMEKKEIPKNLISVAFKSAEAAFLAGIAAAEEAEKHYKEEIYIIAGMEESPVIKQFIFGFKAGVSVVSPNIKVKVINLGSFNDLPGAKTKSLEIFQKKPGNIIFTVAGECNRAVLEAAREKNGVVVMTDKAPDSNENVITTVEKRTNRAVEIVADHFFGKSNSGGENLFLGIEEDCVGLPKDNPKITEEVLKKIEKCRKKIISKEIIPPTNEEEFEEFIKKPNSLE